VVPRIIPWTTIIGSGELAEESRAAEKLLLVAPGAGDAQWSLLQSMHRAVVAESVSSARTGAEKNTPASNMPANVAIRDETFVWVSILCLLEAN